MIINKIHSGEMCKVRSQNEVRELFAQIKMRFARAEQLWRRELGLAMDKTQ